MIRVLHLHLHFRKSCTELICVLTDREGAYFVDLDYNRTHRLWTTHQQTDPDAVELDRRTVIAFPVFNSSFSISYVGTKLREKLFFLRTGFNRNSVYASRGREAMLWSISRMQGNPACSGSLIFCAKTLCLEYLLHSQLTSAQQSSAGKLNRLLSQAYISVHHRRLLCKLAHTQGCFNGGTSALCFYQT